jgi:DNA repair exonuclease SbcCD nuclease subunit
MEDIKTLGVCITDLHLHLNNVSQFESTIDQAIGYCTKNGLTNIFNLGDTFTSRKGQPQEVLKVFRQSLEKCKKVGITMYVIVGNHDKTDYSSEDSFLIAFQDHPALHLVEGYEDVDIVEGVRLHMVSYFEEEVYKKYIKEAKKNILKGAVNICLTHVGISGAKMNSGISLSGNVTAKDFVGFDRVLVGHYHNYQVLNNIIVYIGSSFPHNFGENNEKGIWILNSNGMIEMVKTDFNHYITIENDEPDIDKIISMGSLSKIRLKTSKISTIDRARLEQAGVKVEIEHKDLLLTGSKEVLQTFDDQGLVDAYHEWSVKRDIEDKEKGLALLKQAL